MYEEVIVIQSAWERFISSGAWTFAVLTALIVVGYLYIAWALWIKR